VRYTSQDEFFRVEVEEIEEFCDHTTEVEALIRTVKATFDNYVRVTAKISPETATSIASVDDPAYLADKLVGHLGIKPEDKRSLLECTNPAERLERILGYMRSELEILEVEKRIRSRVKQQVEKTQKEYYLNEQRRAIEEELGEKDEFKNEIQELEDTLRQKKMPAEAREKCEREIKKLKTMPRCRQRRRWYATISTGFLRCRGSSTPRTSSTSRKPSASSKRIITGSRRSSSAFSSISLSKPW
jgi:ATP-dependent Lon protease